MLYQRINQFILVGFLFLITTFLNYDALTAYFSQDDFYHLRQVMDKTVTDIPGFLKFRSSDDQTFYRPVSRETYNTLALQVFNLNPLPYHLINYSLILINCLLSVIIIKRLFKDKLIPYFFAALYLVSNVHNIELYYLASFQNLFSTFWLLLSLIFLDQYLLNKKIRTYILSIIFFTIGLGSHEFAIVFVPIAFTYLVIVKNVSIKKAFLLTLPLLVIFLIRSIGFIIFLGVPQQPEYHPTFSPKSMLNTFIWYVLWCFGLSEMIADFIGPKLQINPNLLKFHGTYFYTSLISLLSMVTIVIFLIIKYKNKLITDSSFKFIILSFCLSLGPFLFFPHHKFIYYLTLPIIWFCIIISVLLSKVARPKLYFLSIAFLAIYFLISIETIQLNKTTAWSAKRDKASLALINAVAEKYPKVEDDTIFYFKNDPDYPFISKEWGSSAKQAAFILSGSDALQLKYRSLKIKSYFEDYKPLPSNIDQSKVKEVEAKFPY